MIEAGDNVISLIPKIQGRCHHRTFVVDHTLEVVVCDQCGERVSPIWVLKEMTQREQRANWKLNALQEQIEKDKKTIEDARNKTRCKCQKCGEMTRIIKFKALS